MSTRYPDARAWAQDHSLASVPRLARLEGVAFQAHPDIVATFGVDGASMAQIATRRSPSPARTATSWLLGILGVIVVLAPIIGVAVYGEAPAHIAPTAEPLEAAVAVPIAGVCFTISALTQAALWVAWLRAGARWAPPMLGAAAISAVLAGFAAIGIPNVAARDDYAVGGWIVPVWVTLVLGAALALAVYLRRRVRPVEPVIDPEPAAPTLADREQARRAAAQLPADEREAVRTDRDDALRILAARGLLDEATLDRALAADLGTLFAFDPIRES